jgi:hypothetical protein
VALPPSACQSASGCSISTKDKVQLSHSSSSSMTKQELASLQAWVLRVIDDYGLRSLYRQRLGAHASVEFSYAHAEVVPVGAGQ